LPNVDVSEVWHIDPDKGRVSGRDPQRRSNFQQGAEIRHDGGTATVAQVAALRKQLANELGRHGIRVVSLLTGGVIDSIPADLRVATRSSSRWSCRPCWVVERCWTTSATSLPSRRPRARARSPHRAINIPWGAIIT
jgi:NAD(P)-dependent dehydrogenase (short-subunit alcohol dehydrogenase family)